MSVEGSPSPDNPVRGVRPRAPADERELVWRIQRGSPAEVEAAFETLISHCRDVITPVIRRRIHNEQDREDAISSVYEVVLRDINNFQYYGVPLAHWFSRIAKNQANAHARRAKSDKSRIELELDDQRHEGPAFPPHADHLYQFDRYFQDDNVSTTPGHAGPPMNDPFQIQRDQLLMSILDELTRTERQVLEQMWFRRTTNAAKIADLLGKDPGAVRTAASRARERIRKIPKLKELYDELTGLFDDLERS